jgi:hypothetical protein
MIKPFLVAACLALTPGQDPSQDRVTTTSGEELRGEIVRIEPDGGLVLKLEAGPRTVSLDDIRRIAFEEKPQVAPDKKGERLWPKFGGSLTGSIVSLDSDRVTIQCPHGAYAIRRDEVRALSFGDPVAGPAEIKEDQDLVLLASEGEKAGEAIAVSGAVEALDGERVRVDGKDYPRKGLREIRFRPAPGRNPALGLFARVQMKNGDGLVGMLRKIEAGRIRLFTHYAGAVSIEKPAIHSISVVPLARLQMGHVLICEPGGVTEIDRRGQKVWTYGNGAVGSASARKLPNGNVLIANPNHGRVIEVRPTGKAGGQTLWTLDSLEHPCDAQRLENGNILVAEHTAGRIAEYELKDRSMKSSISVQGIPTGVERLEGGSTLVSLNQGPVLEIDAKGTIRHRYSISSGMNEYRATRTGEGTILVADQRGTQIVEVDRKNTILWKHETPQPRMAVRLDDGTTLILKRNGEILDIDSSGQTRILGRYPGAGSISVY